ncbi:MAG: PKD domain-containing protein, partial [Bacteroidia bacterium]
GSDTSGQASAQYVYPSATSYTATLVVSNSAGCTDSLKKTVNVKQEVLAGFNYTNACSNAGVQFTDNTIAPLPVSQHTHTWNFNGSSITGISPVYAFGIAGTFPVSLTVNGTNGCVSTVTKMVKVYSSPGALFSSQDFCKNDTIALNNQSFGNQAITAWSWSLDNSFFSASQNPLLSSGTAGVHALRLTLTDSTGCKDSITKNITVHNLPVLDFSTNPSLYLYPFQNITLISNHATGNSYNWSVSNGFSSTLNSPSVVFTDTGTYTVTLVYADSNNCKNTKQNMLSVISRTTDLAIVDLVTSLQTDNFCSVSATLVNTGKVVISTFNLELLVPNSTVIKETWTGTLNPGSAVTHDFQAQPFIKDAGKSEFLCSVILDVNGAPDNRRDNDEYCAAITTLNSLYTLFPNPANDYIHLPFVIGKETKVNIEIFDLIGKLVLSEETSFTNPGLNLLGVSIVSLEKGYYTFRVRMNNRTFTQRFLKD